MAKKKILIIDDEESLCNTVKLNLEEDGGYEVETETRGANGLNAARKFKPDLILLDIKMPDVDGTQVAVRLNADKDTKGIPIIFLTATIDKEEIAKYDGVIEGKYTIAKPATTEEILEGIEESFKKVPGLKKGKGKSAKKIIQVVDDEPVLLRMLQSRLEKQGFEVHCAGNGADALEQHEYFAPDLIILDINMPKMGGIAFYRRLCEGTGEAKYPVLFLTSRAELKEILGKDVNVEGFIAKPFNTGALIKEISGILKDKK